ncbi:MAG: alanine racemase, partial [Bacteroidota bacterium]
TGGKREPQFFTWSKKEAAEALAGALLFSDSASFENAGHCRALMLYLGYDETTIRRRLAKLEPVAMRLELKEGINGCVLINDSYNSDLTSLTIALNFLQQQSKTPRRTVILSDILQSGQPPEQLYGEVAKLLVEKKIDRVIGIGEEVGILERLLHTPPLTPKGEPNRLTSEPYFERRERSEGEPIFLGNISEGSRFGSPLGVRGEGIEAIFFKTTAEFLEALPRLTFQNETILLKGARRFEFERIANRLSTKVHQTTLEINLGALLHNLRVYQSCLQPGTKMMAMVKASAYGSGSEEVAKLLEFQHVDYLGVAYADEGVTLRKAGIRLPIMVMNPEEANFESLVEHRLEPEIYSLALLQKFIRFLRQDDAEAVIHLKFDTGMHRLGFEESDLEELILQLNACPEIKVSTVFSHLAASESPAHDEFTRQQAGQFQKMFERLAEGLGYRPLRHILNSGGIVRFPEFQMDVVRLGA